MNFLSPKRKKKPDARSESRRLVAATCNGWPTALTELARLGVSMNVQDAGGVTPLHIAAITGNNLVAKVLIRHGAEVNCRESSHLSTPLHFAAIKGGARLSSVQAVIELNREIAARGCSHVGEMTLSGETRHSAENYEATIVTLARKGADLNARDASGKTPLHLAVQHRSDDAVKTLLGLGAEVDAEDNEGRLPWHYALEQENCEGLRWLLAFGADINDVDMFGGRDRDRLRRVMTSDASGMRHLLLDQLSRLRAAGLFVASVYEEYESNSRSYYGRCSREVEKMRGYEIEEGVCLYDLLHMSPRRKCAYTRGNEDRTARMLIEFEREFPNYYGIVRACFDDDEGKRKTLVRQAKSAWYHLTNIGLPDICVEQILSNLNGCCLKIMIEGAKHCDALD